VFRDKPLKNLKKSSQRKNEFSFFIFHINLKLLSQNVKLSFRREEVETQCCQKYLQADVRHFF
jgi:hypothetical protein